MKRFNTISYICIVMMICIIVSSVGASVHAADKIDVDKASSLTIQYGYSSEKISNLEVNVYKLADVDAEGTFALKDVFKGYDIDVNNVSSQTEWNKIASTFASYAVADNIKADHTAITDSYGIISVSGLKPGMYLTREVSVKSGDRVVRFESFITVIPYRDANGSYNYNVTVYPKADSYTPEPDEVKYNVIKIWKDSGNEKYRPSEIKIEILKNSQHVSYEILNKENNWSYSWYAADDGSTWDVVEYSKPDSYQAKIIKKGNTITITNTFIANNSKGDETDGKGPKTGDIISIWPYIFAMCFSGVLILLVGIWRKREE